jgi:hypothetical protein
MLQHRMEDVLQLPEIASRLPQTGAVLAYEMPIQYVMQGMIADTDPAYRLYQRHQTLPMIADWVLHPFRHLEGGGHGHAMMHHAEPGGRAASFAARRIIFLEVAGSGDASVADPAALFAMGAVRAPRFYADVDLHTLELLEVKDLGPGTGWGRVPTPMF